MLGLVGFRILAKKQDFEIIESEKHALFYADRGACVVVNDAKSLV